jgi:hypothetical protein
MYLSVLTVATLASRNAKGATVMPMVDLKDWAFGRNLTAVAVKIFTYFI